MRITVTISKLLSDNRIQVLLLFILLVAGFTARMYKIDTPLADWHSFRQADTASVSKTFVEEGINFLIPRYHDVSGIQSGYFNPEGYRMVELPIFSVFHALLVKSTTLLSFDSAGRMVTVLASLVTAVILGLIGKRFMGYWGGFMSAFFFLLIPYNIFFSRVILPEQVASMFAVVSLWLFLKYTDSDKLLILVISGIFLALSLLIKPFTLYYIIPMAYLAIRKDGVKLLTDLKLITKYLLFGFVLIAPLLLWRIWINQVEYLVGVPFYKWILNGDGIRFRPAFWRWIIGERIGRMILGTWGAGLFIVGIAGSKRENLFGVFYMLGAIIYTIVFATANVRHDYYQIIIVPPIAYLLAMGTIYLWKAKNLDKYLARAVVIVSIVMMFGMGAYQVKEFYKINHPEIIVAGEAVKRISNKDDLVIAPYFGDTAFLYQTDRRGWPAVDNSFDTIIEAGADYYVTVTPGDTDSNYISENYEVIDETDMFFIADLHQPKFSTE